VNSAPHAVGHGGSMSMNSPSQEARVPFGRIGINHEIGVLLVNGLRAAAR